MQCAGEINEYLASYSFGFRKYKIANYQLADKKKEKESTC